MTQTITYGPGITITPTLVLAREWTAAGRNNVHPLIGNPEPAVTLRPASAQNGTLSLFFADESAALDAADAHAMADVFTYTDTDRPRLNMRYVLAGNVRVQLDRDTARRWIVAVEYQRVSS